MRSNPMLEKRARIFRWKVSSNRHSPKSKKYSKHELKTRSSAWTKCRHTADTIKYCKHRLLQFQHYTVLSTKIFTPVFTVCDQRKWLFGVRFTCIVFVFKLSTFAKCMNVLYSLNAGHFSDHSQSMYLTSWITEDKKHDIILKVWLFFLIHTCN